MDRAGRQGRAEPGEFIPHALLREVREETGVVVRHPGSIAFVVQVDDRRAGWFATVWTWEIAAWEGEVAPADPDGFVSEAAWVPAGEAIARLERISWHGLTARYLRGELASGSLSLRRVHSDGREELLGPFGAAAA